MMGEQLVFDLPSRPALGRQDFLVAPCNRAAVAWIDRWPDWPAPGLAIWGPAASGKSHLAEVWCRRSEAREVRAMSLATGDAHAALAAGPAVVIEDAEGGLDAGAEEGLFHLYNLLAERGGHVLLTGRRPPARWPLVLADLGSRLAALPAVAIEAPDEALIAALIVKLFADRQLRVGREVLAFLLPRMERSFAAARRLVADIDAAALARQQAVTVPLAREVLARLAPEGEDT